VCCVVGSPLRDTLAAGNFGRATFARKHTWGILGHSSRALRNCAEKTGIRTLATPTTLEPDMTINQVGSFFRRVIQNDSFRRGLASVAAGAIISVICEAVWPSA
jgi:hypothetical protein